MKIFYIHDIANTSYLNTRESAGEIFERAKPDQALDFTNIESVSGAFADEFLKQLYEQNRSFDQTVVNVNSNLARIFQAVQRRRRSRVRV